MENTQQDKLTQQISELTQTLQKSNSFWRAFLLGIVRGLGVAIGATIVAALVIAILVKVFKSLNLDQALGAFGGGGSLPNLEFLQQFSPEDLEKFAR